MGTLYQFLLVNATFAQVRSCLQPHPHLGLVHNPGSDRMRVGTMQIRGQELRKGRSSGRNWVAKPLSLHDGRTLWRAQLVTEGFILRLAHQALRSLRQCGLLPH